jgi:hypothetical protein
MLNEDTIKQIYFYCDEKLPNAVYADEVDIIQFARRVAEFVKPIAAKEEHQRCVGIIAELNKDVSKALDNLPPK